MLRFDNAFLCKNKKVGMQFTNKQGAIISVFHDGQQLRVSEDAKPQESEEAMRKYLLMHKRFKSH